MDGIAKRRFSTGGATYAPGAKVNFPDNQFADFEATGLVERKAEKLKPNRSQRLPPKTESDRRPAIIPPAASGLSPME